MMVEKRAILFEGRFVGNFIEVSENKIEFAKCLCIAPLLALFNFAR